jgi:hypothetical protein
MVLKVHGNTMSEVSPQEFQSEQNVNPITPDFAQVPSRFPHPMITMRATFSVLTSKEQPNPNLQCCIPA